MGVHHFFVESLEGTDETVVLEGDEAHHAIKSLRVEVGERVTVGNGRGFVADTVIESIGESVVCSVKRRRSEDAPRPLVTLHQALMKGDKMDMVVEKSVEVGVISIAPFAAQRSIVKWDAARRRKANERWNAIARAASKQSRAAWLAHVADVSEGVSLDEKHGRIIVLHEEADGRLRDVLTAKIPDAIELIVGPEGGLTDGEVDYLRKAGATVTSLGERILRAETAGVVGAALIGYAYGTLG